jgi:hypothetical protein
MATDLTGFMPEETGAEQLRVESFFKPNLALIDKVLATRQTMYNTNLDAMAKAKAKVDEVNALEGFDKQEWFKMQEDYDKEIEGIMYLLVQAKIECGNLDIIELAPTVQCITGDYTDPSYEVPYLDYILNADRVKLVLFDNYLSEEGGRFFHDVNRNIVVLADDDFDQNLPERYIWLTLNQVQNLLRFNNFFNIQARSLISTFVYG